MSKNKKEKKNKTVYIDDGRTIADMSSLGGTKNRQKKAESSTFKDQLKTFTDAQKAMFLPMLAVLGIIAIAFLLVYILL